MANIMDYQNKKNMKTWPMAPAAGESPPWFSPGTSKTGNLVKVVTWGEAHCGGDSSQVQDQLKVGSWDVRRFWDEWIFLHFFLISLGVG